MQDLAATPHLQRWRRSRQLHAGLIAQRRGADTDKCLRVSCRSFCRLHDRLAQNEPANLLSKPNIETRPAEPAFTTCSSRQALPQIALHTPLSWDTLHSCQAPVTALQRTLQLTARGASNGRCMHPPGDCMPLYPTRCLTRHPNRPQLQEAGLGMMAMDGPGLSTVC
jgi:hypothetical protein